MELNPYLERLGHDLAAAAAAGGPEITRAADLLAGALDASARLCLLEALSDAAAEITGKLDSASVEVRLRGREVDFAVVPIEPAEPPPAPAATAGDRGDLTRMTLRLQEWLKQEVEQAATVAGLSVNSWLAETIANSVKSGPSPRSAPGRPGRRITGYTKA